MTTATISRPDAAVRSRAPDPKPDRPATDRPPTPARPVRPRRIPVRAVAALLVLAVLGGFSWYRYERTAAAGPAVLTLQGNIDVRQVNLSFKVAGRIDRLLVDEGDVVKAGRPVAVLDVRYFEDDLALAKAQRDQAAANYERLKNGFRAEEIKQARAQENERQATLKRAEQDFRRVAALRPTAAVTVQEYDQALAALREAEARVGSAAASRALYEAGSRAEDVAAARAQLAAAEAQVVQAERRLADRTLYAPNDSVILTRARETGAIVNAGETVFTLTLASPVWVRTYVDETDLGAVTQGIQATVKTDTPGSRQYTGHVGFVSPTAEFTPKTVETRELRTDLVYRLRVVVDDTDGGLRQGMPVTTTVALSAPRQRSTWERLLEALWLDRTGLFPAGGR
jgi:HlyD family secretion protein